MVDYSAYGANFSLIILECNSIIHLYLTPSVIHTCTILIDPFIFYNFYNCYLFLPKTVKMVSTVIQNRFSFSANR